MYAQPSQGLPSLAENMLAKRPPMQPPKGSPLPFDLAQMLAKQKVLQAAVDAETQRMLTQSAGGKPPTVEQSLNQKMAQLMNPPQQQAGPDLQTAAMGPGMNNQGAAPPNGGAAPQPQVQAMAAGGLARLPSGLPQSYANGGIIAFKEGEEVDDGTANGYYPKTGREGQRSFGDDVVAWLKDSLGKAGADARRIGVTGSVERGRPTMKDDPRILAPADAPSGEGAAPAAVAKGLPAAAAANGSGSASMRVRTRSSGPSSAAPAAPAPAPVNSVGAAVDKSILSDLNVDKDKAFAEGKQRYQDNMGAAQQGLLSVYQQATEAQKAAIEKSMKNRDDNRWANSMIGMGAAFGGARGLIDPAAAKAYAASVAAGHASDSADVGAIQKLLTGNAEQQFKAASDTYGAGNEGIKGAMKQREGAITAGSGRANNADTNATHERTTAMNNATSLAVARIGAEAREIAAALRQKSASKDEFNANMRGLIQIEMKNLDEFKGKDFLSPEAKARKAAIHAKVDALTAAMTEHDPRLVPKDAPVSQEAALQSAAAAEKARRASKG